jgi:hypothetical protein
VKVFTTSIGGSEMSFNGNDNKFSNSTLPADLYVEGCSAGSYMREAQISAEVYGVSACVDSVSFTALWVDMNCRTIGQASWDNNRRDNYQAVAGTYDLGPIIEQNIADLGIEIVGSVHPFDFTELVALRREFNSARTYLNNTQDSSSPFNNDGGIDDTSDPIYVDDDPQSNNSVGTIYDLDLPGLAFNPSLAVGTIRRHRFNFREWAEYDDGTTSARCSEYFPWFARQSIVKHADPNGWHRETGVPTDNQVGQGQTPITWDLQ